MWGRRIIITQKLTDKVIKPIHEQHPRIVRSKMIGVVWWPKIDKDTENLAKECRICRKIAKFKGRTRIIMVNKL